MNESTQQVQRHVGRALVVLITSGCTTNSHLVTTNQSNGVCALRCIHNDT